MKNSTKIWLISCLPSLIISYKLYLMELSLLQSLFAFCGFVIFFHSIVHFGYGSYLKVKKLLKANYKNS